MKIVIPAAALLASGAGVQAGELPGQTSGQWLDTVHHLNVTGMPDNSEAVAHLNYARTICDPEHVKGSNLPARPGYRECMKAHGFVFIPGTPAQIAAKEAARKEAAAAQQRAEMGAIIANGLNNLAQDVHRQLNPPALQRFDLSRRQLQHDLLLSPLWLWLVFGLIFIGLVLAFRLGPPSHAETSGARRRTKAAIKSPTRGIIAAGGDWPCELQKALKYGVPRSDDSGHGAHSCGWSWGDGSASAASVADRDVSGLFGLVAPDAGSAAPGRPLTTLVIMRGPFCMRRNMSRFSSSV
jgi:hypothetical protein